MYTFKAAKVEQNLERFNWHSVGHIFLSLVVATRDVKTHLKKRYSDLLKAYLT